MNKVVLFYKDYSIIKGLECSIRESYYNKRCFISNELQGSDYKTEYKLWLVLDSVKELSKTYLDNCSCVSSRGSLYEALSSIKRAPRIFYKE